MLRLFDTAIGDLAEIVPVIPGKFSMYVCGPTVYDLAHLGHGRYALVFDVLRRYLEWRGLKVRHVSNITDVDDKILERAEVEHRSPFEVASEFEAKWFSTMDQLGVLKPHLVPHATEYVEQMIGLIESLFKADAAYIGDDGIYFDSAKVADYGLLARQSLDSLKAGARIAEKGFKRSPMDFVLWKFSDGSSWSWDSPWGPGRPGWHTECVVMSVDLLGEQFDLHGGGLDLSFPHHENERAQAVVMDYKFARHWVHNGFVMVGNDKMSKSLGNFTTLDELLLDTDPRAYRLLVLQSHYRSPLEVNAQTLSEASRALMRLDFTQERVTGLGVDLKGSNLDETELAAFTQSMDDDLDTASATARLFELRSSVNQLLDEGRITEAVRTYVTMEHLFAALGLNLSGPPASEVPPNVLELLEQRAVARTDGNYVLSDSIRQELLDFGYVVEDTFGGQKIKKVR
ncbi:MAG: cysteine--tRNA ligase [Acidimicrobiaceae bacterium]|nr:cysteine--tRNA ligase [Acidimicrobiaceae bacterium]